MPVPPPSRPCCERDATERGSYLRELRQLCVGLDKHEVAQHGGGQQEAPTAAVIVAAAVSPCLPLCIFGCSYDALECCKDSCCCQ